MQKLFLFAALLSFAACTKKVSDTYSPAISARAPFFKNASETFDLVSKQVRKFHANENLKSVDRVSYLFSGNKGYAIVFYTTNKSTSNMVVKKEYTNGLETGVSVTKCSGSSCNCTVNAVIGNDGNVEVSCSCSSTTEHTCASTV